MKKVFLLFTALCLAIVGNAQISTHSSNDANLDGKVDISDVNHTISEICGNGESQLVVSVDSIYDLLRSVNPDIAKMVARKLGLSTAPDTTTYTHEYVDLGLPSGTLWATCNVGAYSPVGFGDYFAWGETTPQSSNAYSWTSYEWCNGAINTMTKYCSDTTFGTPDYVMELDVTDDAAYVNWGSEWRMPNQRQFTELKDNCTWTWTSMNYVNGYIVTGKNGNSIFLPAAGVCSDSTFTGEGSLGGYWSLWHHGNNNNWATGLYFNSENSISTDNDFENGKFNERHCGLCVRPVYIPQIEPTPEPEPDPTPTPTNDNLLSHKFSISDTKQVQFTKGNLYWNGSDFKFEANQTDYPTSWDANHVGHLYWTATAADSYAETNNSVAPDGSRFLTDEFFADGRDAGHMMTVEGTDSLYVLSNAEWEYLIYSRRDANTNSLYKYGVTVTNGDKSYANCLIIAPDDFTGELQSSYTLDEVNAAGFVCLPTAGYRDGSSLTIDGDGYYWSGTLISFLKAGVYDLRFNGDYADPVFVHDFNRYIGLSVRLAKDAEGSDSGPRTLISSISIEPSTVTLTPGDVATLTVTISPTNASNKNLIWSSTDWSVANVEGGIVTAIGEGTATITCSANDGSGVMASCTVTVVSGYDPGTTTTDANLLPGKFSVSLTKKVQFTKSNLYWDGSALKFEANQTDYPTSWDASHVGHFFWRTITEYQSGKDSYMPYSESYMNSYLPASDKFWCGEDNPLTVEGTSGLYALTGDFTGEWDYLFYRRANASNLYKYGVTVTNGEASYANCLILAPDGFPGTLQSSYTLDEINAAGLVCLPAAGCCQEGTSFFGCGDYGYYWTATQFSDSDYSAYIINFDASNASPINGCYRSSRRSLRLVRSL